MIANQTPEEAAGRFWKYVRKTDTCWLWTGGTRGGGYGHFRFRGSGWLPHRFILELVGRAAPEDMVVDHVCRVRTCVNPDHLRVTTRGWNARFNNDSPFGRNAQKDRCKHGHAWTEENTALRACTGPRGTPMVTRICLTCYPANWRFAIIERKPPPGSRHTWLGPQRAKLLSEGKHL